MNPPASPTTSGPAFRVSILGPEQSEAYERVHVVLDERYGVVHVFGADGQTHFLTIPLSRALIEWHDPAALQPQPRIPPYGAGAFERLGVQVQRMAEGVSRAFGQDPRD